MLAVIGQHKEQLLFGDFELKRFKRIASIVSACWATPLLIEDSSRFLSSELPIPIHRVASTLL
jgi:hypothetical protein